MNKYEEYEQAKRTINLLWNGVPKSNIEYGKPQDFINKAYLICIEALEKAQEYDERMTPHKPIRNIHYPYMQMGNSFYSYDLKMFIFYTCKNCGNQLNAKMTYCSDCGCLIDWSEKE